MKTFQTAILTVTALALSAPVLWTNAAARAAPTKATAIECNPFLPPHGNFIGCDGDCDLNGTVGVDELIRVVNIILGTAPPSRCPPLLGTPTVSDVLQGVASALGRCPGVAHYQLTEGSTIAYYAGSPTPGIEEPLSGTFVLVNRGIELQFADAQITKVEFQAENFTVTGGSTAQVGCLQTSSPSNATFSATVLINGDSVPLVGARGTVLTAEFPPPEWIGMETCGTPGATASCEDITSRVIRGYALTLFARLEE